MNPVKKLPYTFWHKSQIPELSIAFLYTAFPFPPKQCDTNPLLPASLEPPVRGPHAGASAALKQVKGMGRAFLSAQALRGAANSTASRRAPSPAGTAQPNRVGNEARMELSPFMPLFADKHRGIPC